LEGYKKRRGEGRQLTDHPDGISDKEWERRCRVAKLGAPIRANREISTLKVLFNKCIAWGLFEGDNPALKVRLRREPKGRERYLEPDEEHRLLAQLSGTLHALVRIGINTGLRVEAELLTLQWSSVDLRRATVTVEAAYSKNGKTRTVPLNSIALEALKTLKLTATSDYVFAKKDGSPYEGIGTSFRRARDRANLPDVTPHTLRHTFASRLAMAGVDMRTLQELGGWQTLGMVQRYAHLAPSHKAQASNEL
jgi:integrase